MKQTLIAVLGLALCAQAQVIVIPHVVSTPDGVVAGFTDVQVRWWGLEGSDTLKCETSGPFDFSGPILGTRVRDQAGNEVALYNFYPNTGLLVNVSSIAGKTWHWDYLTALYPQGELTVTAAVIPEPSTYALIAGLGLVAFAAVRRWQGCIGV